MFINLNQFGNSGGGGTGYTLPIASQSVLGGIKVGENLTIDSAGTLSADAQAVNIATTATTGVVKIGEGVNIDSAGTISVDVPEINVATTASTGVVKIGKGINIDSAGTISSIVDPYEVWQQSIYLEQVLNIRELVDFFAFLGINQTYLSFPTVENEVVGESFDLVFSDVKEGMALTLYDCDKEYIQGEIILTPCMPYEGYVQVFATADEVANIHTIVAFKVEDEEIEEETYYYYMPYDANEVRFSFEKVGDEWTYTTSITKKEQGGGYVLPTATANILGGVKIGGGINIDSAGTISVSGSDVANYAMALKSTREIDGNNFRIVNEGGWLYYVDEMSDIDEPNAAFIKAICNLSEVYIDIETNGSTDNELFMFYPSISVDSEGNLYYVNENDEEVYYNSAVTNYHYGDFTFTWNDNGKHIEFNQQANPIDIIPVYCNAEIWHLFSNGMRMANQYDLGLVKIGQGIDLAEDGTISVQDGGGNNGLKFWKGTQNQYDAIGSGNYDASTLYIIIPN